MSAPASSRSNRPSGATRKLSRRPRSSVMYSLLYWITVSTMEIGAGSSGLSTRPILPTASSTSGMLMMRRSSSRMMSVASPMEAWGMVVGM